MSGARALAPPTQRWIKITQHHTNIKGYGKEGGMNKGADIVLERIS